MVLRREFLKAVGAGACAACAGGFLVRAAVGQNADPAAHIAVHDASWFERLDRKVVQCRLCARECQVPVGRRGHCGVRENRDGDFKTLVYGAVCTLTAGDPIEKKPLFHYLPGTRCLSAATAGCNFECKFCQNWQISQYRPEEVDSRLVPPEAMAQIAVTRGLPTMAFTYSEPTVFSEFARDAAAAGRERGIGSVYVSNGYLREGALRDLCRHLTAIKIDLKAFTEEFYNDQCGGRLAPVLETLEVLKDIGIHTEIVVLLIPTLNDSAEEIGEMARWIVDHLGPDVPLHFSRFQPMYRLMNLPPTPIETLERARKVSMDAGLRYVYIGNVPMHPAESTYCPSCGKVVIKRIGYNVDLAGLKDGACASCGQKIAGVWSSDAALGFKPRPKSTPAAPPPQPAAEFRSSP